MALTLFLLVACGQQNKVSSYLHENDDDITNNVENNIELHYASLLSMKEVNGSVIATVINPWDTSKILQKIVIKNPKKNAAVFILSHSAILHTLGCDDFFTDMSDTESLDVEKIVEMGADAILVSPFENSGGYGGIEKLGIDIIECADYMESTPLGRAEWIKFYGRLFGVADKADSLFNVVEHNYIALKDSALRQSVQRPTVTCDLISGSTWYVPGGNSTIGHLIEDAGGDYIFKDYDQTGSVPLAPETVFERSVNADIWILRYGQDSPLTYSQLAQDSHLYPQLKAFKKHQIYACNVYKTSFFQQTPFRPDYLLSDLIHIFQHKSSGHYFKHI